MKPAIPSRDAGKWSEQQQDENERQAPLLVGTASSGTRQV